MRELQHNYPHLIDEARVVALRLQRETVAAPDAGGQLVIGLGAGFGLGREAREPLGEQAQARGIAVDRKLVAFLRQLESQQVASRHGVNVREPRGPRHPPPGLSPRKTCQENPRCYSPDGLSTASPPHRPRLRARAGSRRRWNRAGAAPDRAGSGPRAARAPPANLATPAGTAGANTRSRPRPRLRGR